MIAYLDLPSGISGDMFLSCLVDAGWPVEALREAVGSLKLPGESFSVSCNNVMKGPLRATQVTVEVGQSHHKRNLPQIRQIIEQSPLSQPIKDRALAIFTTLAQAEAKVHGTSLDEVHFHEVGAVDAIVDIVGASAGIEALGIGKLYCSALPLGEGWIKAAHGQLPLPAPATLEILAAAKAPTRPAPGPGELVTPTGAAIVATLATFEQPEMTLHRVGLGGGQKSFSWPNIARFWVGEPVTFGQIVQVETNIDDMNPQLYAPVMEELLSAGALDVWLSPVQMKKSRPGTVVSVLCSSAIEDAVVGILMRETTTLGVRVRAVHRHEAQRKICAVQTSLGEVRVKIKSFNGQTFAAVPEFDDCRRLAEANGLPIQQVMDLARRAASALENAT